MITACHRGAAVPALARPDLRARWHRGAQHGGERESAVGKRENAVGKRLE